MSASFVLVATASSLPLQLLGVACASAQGSMGEASMLALASRYELALAQTRRALPEKNPYAMPTRFEP